MGPDSSTLVSTTSYLTKRKCRRSSIVLTGGMSRDTGIFARKTMDYVRDGGIGHSEKGDYFVVKAAVQYINPKNDPWYMACKKCNKKVNELGLHV